MAVQTVGLTVTEIIIVNTAQLIIVNCVSKNYLVKTNVFYVRISSIWKTTEAAVPAYLIANCATTAIHA